MKEQGYTVIPDEFLGLGLNVYETLALSVIYGFSQDGNSLYAGGLRYLATKCLCSRETIKRALKTLTEQGYIEKQKRVTNGVTYYDYRVGSERPGVGSERPGGRVRETHQNKIENIYKYNTLSNTREGKFQKPSVTEVSEYCQVRKNAIDPQHFCDFYESNGWRVGKNPMKDWKAAVRTWEKRQGVAPAQHRQRPPMRSATVESFHQMQDLVNQCAHDLNSMNK